MISYEYNNMISYEYNNMISYEYNNMINGLILIIWKIRITSDGK